jgi:uncharacterized protein (TIGR02246 family)
MKRLLMLIPLVFLCCLGCQQGEEPATVDVEADIQAIKDIVADFNVASDASDLERVMSYYADDAIAIPPNEPAATGKAAIRSWMQQFYDAVIPKEEYVVDGVEISCGRAYARITWSGTFTPKDGGEQRKSNGNWIWIFKKQPDDIWKIVYMMWSNETLVKPSPVE